METLIATTGTGNMNRSKQEDEFSTIINAHKDKLYRICYGYCSNQADVQDVYQEVLIKIWKYLPNFKGDSKITTWLYRIAVNTCLTFVASQKKRQEHFSPLQEHLAHVGTRTNEHQQQQSEQLQHLQWCIGQLASMDRSLMLLSLEGLSYDEISEVTGLTSSNIGVRLHRAKAKLKEMIL